MNDVLLEVDEGSRATLMQQDREIRQAMGCSRPGP